MQKVIQKSIVFVFHLLFFFTPFIFYPHTSELFEFNKMIFIYAATVTITSLWLLRMTLEKRIIFSRTTLDLPLALFLISQAVSTLYSIDPHTSLFGFYSRFHGGLLSMLSYALLYWAFVANSDKKQAYHSLLYLLASGFLVALYGVLQHFGIDKSIWVQDVQNRVFATLGQPNWLAAWIVSLAPLTWSLSINSSSKKQNTKIKRIPNLNSLITKIKNSIPLFLSILFFAVLLFTKSRSGLLGFGIASFIFWGLAFVKNSRKPKLILKPFLILNTLFVLLFLTIDTPWQPNLFQSQTKHPSIYNLQPTTSLEGGTESADIRKIVWRGAVDIWQANLLLGTGVETFGYSYYMYRPVEHNLTSEWDFLYNKAHNEYLNFAANSGTVGLISYIVLILFSVIQISKKLPITNLKKLSQLEIRSIRNFRIALLSGYTSLLVTNFFGFSITLTALNFFIFPAVAVAISQNLKAKKDILKPKSLNLIQLVLIVGITLTSFYLLLSTYNYWRADIYFAKAQKLNSEGNFIQARVLADQALSISKNEPKYWTEKADATSNRAIELLQKGDETSASGFIDSAISEITFAEELSPYDVSIKRKKANLLLILSAANESYLTDAIATLKQAVKIAPTDAALLYNLSIAHARVNEIDKAIEGLYKVVELKANYAKAHLALAVLLENIGQIEEAKKHLKYILENIDPQSSTARSQLERLER